MADLQEIAALAETGTPTEIFAALQEQVQADIGAIIFSCSTFDLAAGKSSRIYTNLPDVYPVSGLKDIVPNDWTRQVLEGRRPFVANTLDVIRTVFPDHEIIGGLGCGAVINMPVFLSGRFLGTVNVLHEPGHYTPERLRQLEALRPAAMLGFAALAIAA